MKSLRHRYRHRPLCFSQLIPIIFISIILFPNEILSLRAAKADRGDTGSGDSGSARTATLSNSHSVPLVGIGAGSIPHQKIPLIISSSLTSPVATRLYDTSRSSSNEALVARALARGMKQLSKVTKTGTAPSALPSSSSSLQTNIVHVITKVWYTHLGYERTNLSVRESLNDLSPILTAAPDNWKIKIHVLLQWPRCDDHWEWTDCEEEEKTLDEHTKSLGASPLLNKEGAWKDSWKALEELYEAGILESIGISNFNYADMMELLDVCNVKPHIYQGNLWNLVFDKDLMELLKSNGIFFQAFNIMKGVIEHKEGAPKAFQVLEKIANSHHQNQTKTVNQNFVTPTVSQLLMAWLVQRGVGVLVSTSDQQHLVENSPDNVHNVPPLLSRHDTDIQTAVGALLKQIDLTDFHYSGDDPDKGVVAVFFNAFQKAVKVFLLSRNGIQVPVSGYMEPGNSNRIVANPQDVFVVYDVYGTALKKFRVMADHGEEETFSIEEQ